MAKAVADGDFERCIVLREKVKSIKLAHELARNRLVLNEPPALTPELVRLSL